MNSKGVYVGAVAVCKMPKVEVYLFNTGQCPKCKDKMSLRYNFCPTCGIKPEPIKVERFAGWWYYVNEYPELEDHFYQLPVKQGEQDGVRFLVGNLLGEPTKINTEPGEGNPTDLSTKANLLIQIFEKKYAKELQFLEDQGIDYTIQFMSVPWWEY